MSERAEAPLKRFAQVRYGLGQPPPLADLGIPILRATNIERGRINPKGLIYADQSDLPLDRAPLLETGEILVVRSGAYTADSALITDEWAGSAPGYDLRLTPRRGVEGRYLAYCLLSERAIREMTLMSSRAAQPHLNAEELGELRVSVPGPISQRAIADYLDAETARIDALIAKKQRLIDLLDERIDASIMHIVGKSQVVDPVGTPVNDVRRLLRKVDRPAATDEMITAFRDGQVTTRVARGKDGFTNSWTDGARVQGVQRGDVVVHGLDGFSGAIGDSEADGACSPVYHVCEPADGGDSAFYGRMLRLLALTGYLGSFAVSTRERAVDFRNWDLFGRIPIPVVDASVQHAIGDRIRALRPLVALVERSEALAVERKNALITGVVAGELALM